MANRSALNAILSILISGSMLFGSYPQVNAKIVTPPSSVTAAAPISPVDETKVPHYFGPYANWANSPLTLPDVVVTIDPPITLNGTQATAQATIGANGAVTALTITYPGSGYDSITPPNVTINNAAGTNPSATAQAVVTGTGVVTSIMMDASGSGYTAPIVNLTGGGTPTTPATAVAYGGVDAIAVSDGGSGYTNPVVDFDFPDDPNGTIAKAHAVLDLNGTVISVVVDDPGSGYLTAPNVLVRDGPVYAPVNNREVKAAKAAREKVIKDQKAGPLTASEANAIGPAATTQAITTATLKVLSVTVTTFGAGYTSIPLVEFTDSVGTGSGASATAQTDTGAVTGITILTPGSGYITPGGIQKFTDSLPGLCDPTVSGSCPALLLDASNDPLPMVLQPKYIPLAVPENKLYNGVAADEIEIGLVQYRTSFSSSLKDANGLVGTLVRGYVQLESASWLAVHPGVSQHYPLTNEMMDGSLVPVTINGVQAYGVTPPQYLGPIIAATKDKPVRLIFRNLLPTGSAGDLYLPTDSTLMGSGMGPTGMWVSNDLGTTIDEVRNPLCTQDPKIDMCFKDNRATLHLHGGITPWISDGTPHQWITPANETTPWPEGVSVSPVPDMAGAGCDGATDGCMTFYYTNQQSARLMFYHDHAYGITRLNVYVGEAAGYLISDETEKALIGTGKIPGPADTIPLIVQDKTFVPQDAQLYGDVTNGVYGQDPTWDAARWGGYGSFWYHHVYMPAQNPGDPTGASAYGRWMYGPWFWPPAANTVFGPIPNPYYNMDPLGPDRTRGTPDDFTTPLAKPCSLADPTSWQYQVDPFCEPALIPGTPNISVGMEQYSDTPVVNGTAYPTITLEPKTYRLRMLNAANDRFFNFQWYVGDPNTASTSLNKLGEVIGATEVALDPALLAAAQTDPNVFPTPIQSAATAGPDWIQIASEGGFLPAPVVIDGQQVTTWITDPARFDVGNYDKHSLLLAPAERADVIVDFSQFAGKTLILYNDFPAPVPARAAQYDYYTGAPDLSPVGAPTILPGYGPNTRTIMQVKIAGTPAPAFNLAALRNAFSHKINLSGVFESGQHPIIVGQAAYNSAYGTSFVGSSWCNAPGSTLTNCDGFVRVSDTMDFGFNTLKSPLAKQVMPLEPKAIHDEMNSTTFDDYGRMQATLGVEAQPPSPGVQNGTLYPYVNPQTELIDTTNLPKNVVTYDSTTGLPVSDIKITAISSTTDGTQIWRITHNGVDTHPVHFHLFDVQTLNRVTWDNNILPIDPNELGWKETLRVSPLEDTIVALRPIVPQLPWELPNAIRNLNVAMPTGATAAFNNVDPQGNPTNPIVNTLVNFGWEYVYHCHILSHEEMDMMRPVSVAVPPIVPTGLGFTTSGSGKNAVLILTWEDNSINETQFVILRSPDGVTWSTVGTVPSPLDQPNTHGIRSFTDTTYKPGTNYYYQVIAQNTIGYGNGFPVMTAQSTSAVLNMALVPLAPSSLTASLQAGPGVNLTWFDNATNETNTVVQRSLDGVNFTTISILPGTTTTGSVSYPDTTVVLGNTYTYRVFAAGTPFNSAYSNPVTIDVKLPAAPTNLGVTTNRQGATGERAILSWIDNANNETGFTIQWSSTVDFGTIAGTANTGANATTFVVANIARQAWYFRIRADNVLGSSAWLTSAQIAPAAAVKSPLVFMSSFSFGMAGWTGRVGDVQVKPVAAMGHNDLMGLVASWGDDDSESTATQPAYVFHEIPNALGSFMANFYFHPNGSVTGDTPMDIFTGLDADGMEIFGVQYRHTSVSPDVYQVRGWVKTAALDIYTAWVPLTNLEQNIQLDWQSSQTSSLNIYVEGEMVASVGADTSSFQLVEERLGPSRGLGGITPLTVGALSSAQSIYLDEFISLSTEIINAYHPTVLFLPFLVIQ